MALCQCLGGIEVEAGENPSRLAATLFALHQEAEYTSAVVTGIQMLPNLLQSGGVHIRPYTSGRLRHIVASLGAL